MLGLVIDVDRRANLSIDKRIETSPQCIAQLQRVVGASIGSPADARKLARDLELDRRISEPALLSMPGGFAGDANYDAMLTEYMAILSAPPPRDESPDLVVDMISRLIDSKHGRSCEAAEDEDAKLAPSYAGGMLEFTRNRFARSYFALISRNRGWLSPNEARTFSG
jgi:hypothetical protein